MKAAWLTLVVLSLALGCKDRAPEPSTAPRPVPVPMPVPMPPMGGGHGNLPSGHPPIDPGQGGGNTANNAPQGGLTWTDPPGWVREQPASTMRRAQLGIPGPAGNATLAVFYFGQGQGGALEDNLNRWYDQFEQPDGGSTRATATREQRTVNGMAVTITTARGRFAGGGMTGAPSTPQEDWALLGAIAETREGPWFFKVTGPRATVEAARPAFDALVASFRLP